MKKILLACLLTTCLSVSAQADPYCSVGVDDTTITALRKAVAEALEANGFDAEKIDQWRKSGSNSLEVDFANKLITPGRHGFHATLCDSVAGRAPNCAAIPGLYATAGKKIAEKARDLKAFYSAVLTSENFRPKITGAQNLGNWVVAPLSPTELTDNRTFAMDDRPVSQPHMHISLFRERDVTAADNMRQRVRHPVLLTPAATRALRAAVINHINDSLQNKRVTLEGVSCSR